MTSVPPLPPYWPKKLKRLRLRHLQSRTRLRKRLLVSIVRREKSQLNLKRVHHSSRRLPQPNPPRARHPPHNQLHHRSLPQPQVHTIPISRTTILLIHTRPTIPLHKQRMATRNLTLRILNPPHCTQSIRQPTIRHCSPVHLLSIHPILLRNHLPRSIMLTIFQVMKK